MIINTLTILLKGCVKVNSISLYLNYSYGGQYSYGTKKFNDYNYHQLGIGFSHFFYNHPKFKPYWQIEGSMQIATNYKNGVLKEDLRNDEFSRQKPLEEQTAVNGNSFSSYAQYDDYYGNSYYQSTFFIGSLLIGCRFQLYKTLFLDFGLGLGIRDVKVRTPISDIIIHNMVYSADAQLGLSYVFTFKKKQVN